MNIKAIIPAKHRILYVNSTYSQSLEDSYFGHVVHFLGLLHNGSPKKHLEDSSAMAIYLYDVGFWSADNSSKVTRSF